MEEVIYSYSKIKDFQSCKLYYKYKHLDKIPELTSSAAQLGRQVHEFIERYSIRCLSSKIQSDDQFAKSLTDEIITQLDADLIDTFISIIETYLESHLFIDENDILTEVEKKLAFYKNWEQCDFDDDKAYFRGIIDFFRVFADSVRIVDYKTNRKIRPTSEVKHDFQLKTYAWFCYLLYPEFEKYNVTLDFVRYRTQIGPIFFDREDVKQFGKYIDNYIKKIECTNKWEPMLSSHCEYCGYAFTHCPAFKNAELETIIPNSIDEAMKAAELLYIYDKRVDELRAKLKNWITKNESSLIVGDIELDFHFSPEKKIKDSKQAFDALKNLGVPEGLIWENIGITKTSVERILKKSNKREMVKVMIKDLFEDKGVTKFKFKKI